MKVVHYAMFKFNAGHTSISEYDVHFEKVHGDYALEKQVGVLYQVSVIFRITVLLPQVDRIL